MPKPKPTQKQLAFVETMTERQWMVLGSLLVPYYLSASERADPALWALVCQGLACTYPAVIGVSALYMWRATEIGEALVTAHFKALKSARVLPTTPAHHGG